MRQIQENQSQEVSASANESGRKIGESMSKHQESLDEEEVKGSIDKESKYNEIQVNNVVRPRSGSIVDMPGQINMRLQKVKDKKLNFKKSQFAQSNLS